MTDFTHFKNLSGAKLLMKWHDRSEHWSIIVSEVEGVSIQCYVVDLEVYDDHATLFCWTEQGDMSITMNLSKEQAFALDKKLRRDDGHYDGLVIR